MVAGHDHGFAGFQARPRQVEHLGRLHVGESPEHLLEFGQVVNRANRLRGRREVPSGEISRVSTTSPNAAAQASKWSISRLRKPLGVEKALERVHLDHRVGNRRAGGKRDPVPRVALVQVVAFMSRSNARSLPPVWMPATRSIFVGVSRFL